ncbi:MAG TPA: hypothetical protein VMJ66_15575 [Geobacteraceae bacterium]|nr:hypothetical protein [Geobacteraceae bacterium]
MDKSEIINRTTEALAPFETENIVKFIKGLTFSTIFGNPFILCFILVIFFFAVIKRSKFILLFLFACISGAALIHYTLPDSGEMSLSSLLPFAGGGVAIGAVLIYFGLIKSE